MNKRKLMLVAVALCMVAVLVTGGTLAYLTDTDNAKNVFTVGNIQIELIEEQRKDPETDKTIEPFEDDKILLPLVGSAQGEKEPVEASSGTVYVPTYEAARNWVDKIVNVKNTSSSKLPAYVRVLFAFPAALDDANSAAEMLMHWNHDGSEEAGLWSREDAGVSIVLEDGITYNVYTYTYLKVLEYNAVTKSPAITGVYIDSRVDATTNADGTITYSFVNNSGVTKSVTFPANGGPSLYVVTQGVQADGFDDAKTALTAAFGAVDATNCAEWFKNVQ